MSASTRTRSGSLRYRNAPDATVRMPRWVSSDGLRLFVYRDPYVREPFIVFRRRTQKSAWVPDDGSPAHLSVADAVRYASRVVEGLRA